jgi:hypothetical protein
MIQNTINNQYLVIFHQILMSEILFQSRIKGIEPPIQFVFMCYKNPPAMLTWLDSIGIKGNPYSVLGIC